jgi:hypothetical protein
MPSFFRARARQIATSESQTHSTLPSHRIPRKANESSACRWVAAIRLAGWENSRLQEVYTGHLIRATLKAPLGPQLTPAAPTLAGWFDVRTFGSRSWTHLWVVLSIASPRQEAEDRLRAAKAAAIAAQAEADATSAVIGSAKSRKRLSNMFGGSKDAPPAPTPYHPPVPGDGSPTSAGGGLAAQQHQPQQLDPTLSNVPVVKASFYLTPPGTTSTATVAASSAASRQSSLSQAQQRPQLPTQPVLVISDLHQAYAVFPETPAAVDASGMFKLEGAMRGDAVGASGRKREEGWCLLIPGDKRGDEWVSGGKHEMIRWLTGTALAKERVTLSPCPMPCADDCLVCRSLPRRLSALRPSAALLVGPARPRLALLRPPRRAVGAQRLSRQGACPAGRDQDRSAELRSRSTDGGARRQDGR